MDTRPEDLLITPVIDKAGGIRYVASSLVTAMICGGVCILDEANRMSEKSWASLRTTPRHPPLHRIDRRRIKNHRAPRISHLRDDERRRIHFRNPRIHPQPFTATDLSGLSRSRRRETDPARKPPFLDVDILEYVVNFLQRAHAHNENYTIRDGINVARYAAKRLKSLENRQVVRESILQQAIVMTLGEEALAYVV